MRATALVLVAIASVAAHAQTPLPAQFCPQGVAPPLCGLLPSDDHVRRAELATNKLSALLFASYMNCVKRAVNDQTQARRTTTLADCASTLTQRFVTRFDAIVPTPSCENFGLLASHLLMLVRAEAAHVYCNGTLQLNFGVSGRVPRDLEVARVEFGAWKLIVKEYRGIVKCYSNGVESEAMGRNADITGCVTKLRVAQDKRGDHFDFGLPGFGNSGCFDEQAGTDIAHLLSGIGAAANRNHDIFCSM